MLGWTALLVSCTQTLHLWFQLSILPALCPVVIGQIAVAMAMSRKKEKLKELSDLIDTLIAKRAALLAAEDLECCAAEAGNETDDDEHIPGTFEFVGDKSGTHVKGNIRDRAKQSSAANGRSADPAIGNTKVLPELPDGIVDVDHWGRTIVSFGKKENGCTFLEVASNPDSRFSDYRRWLQSQSSVSPQVDDLKKFVSRYYIENASLGGDACIVYPGTNIPRVFKPADK